MRTKLLAGAAVAAALVASSAAAQVNGLYGAPDLGYHQPEGIEATSSNDAPDGRPYSWTFDSEDDYAGFARVGYRISPQFRVELEGGYRASDVESVRGEARGASVAQGLCTLNVPRTGANAQCGSPSGTIEAQTLMLNGVFDFGFAFLQRFVPFIGVGVNRVSVDVIGQVSNVGAASATNPAVQNLTIDDEDVTLAYQGLAGLTFNATERLALDLTYRYLSGSDITVASLGSAPGGVQPGAFSGAYEEQSLTLGVRYAFAPPPAPVPPPPPLPAEPSPPPPVEVPPPPPPAPAPAPAPVFEAREFIVYFPFDQATLTPEARTVVQEAATYAASGGAAQVQVVGHADTSGSAAYNIRLSERRARAVADAMVGLGADPALITADWRGEANPAVPTGDGVREPLNRRATVNIN